MLDRKTDFDSVRAALKRSRVVALLGPRQCGKTTLARMRVPPDSVNYFDLEDPASLARLDQPMTALEALRVSRDSFDQGLITSLDLLQTERAERQAESQRRGAELGLWSARFEQRRSLGLPPL